MLFLYNIGIYSYFLLILLSSPFNKKAKLWIKGRKNIFKRLAENIDSSSKIAWFHCASLGEFEQGRPVIEEFKKKYNTYKILVTFFSPSGYEIRKNYKEADYIFYLPVDFKCNVKKFIKIVNPQIAFFVKYEFWYNYLNELNNSKVPTYIFSANFRKEQIFFKSYGEFYKNMLKYFNHIFVQNENSLQLLQTIGINNITISGDTRFDRVYTIAQNSTQLPLIEIFKQNKLLFIAGSTWEKDAEILIKYINSTKNNIKFIIAPHEISNSNIEQIYSSVNKKVVKYSEAKENDIADYSVLIIDNIGMLSSLYKYAEIAYIGGGFGKGIHNLLEAATFGMPVIFGPNHHKFVEATDLIKMGAGFEISGYDDFCAKINEFIDNPTKLSDASFNAKSYVERNIGATKRILENIKF